MPQPSDTPAARIKAAVIQLAEGLTLPGLAGGFVSQIVPDLTNVSLPCGSLCSAGEAEEELEGGGTESQDTDFGWRLLFLDRPGNRAPEKEPVYLDWRKRAMDRFRPNKANVAALRALVPGVWRCLVRPLPVFDEALAALPAYQAILSGFVVRVAYTEPRA